MAFVQAGESAGILAFEGVERVVCTALLLTRASIFWRPAGSALIRLVRRIYRGFTGYKPGRVRYTRCTISASCPRKSPQPLVKASPLQGPKSFQRLAQGPGTVHRPTGTTLIKAWWSRRTTIQIALAASVGLHLLPLIDGDGLPLACKAQFMTPIAPSTFPFAFIGRRSAGRRTAPPVHAVGSDRALLGAPSVLAMALLLLGTLSSAKADVAVAARPSVASEQFQFLKVAGKLRPAGDFPTPQRGATVSSFADGSVLAYGDDLAGGDLLSSAARHASLRNRRIDANVRGPMPGAQLWDPSARVWRTISDPAACPGAAYLHTATLISATKLMIVGGVCDIPRMADDTTPLADHTVTSVWDQSAQRWASGPKLLKGRIHHTASLLSDGSVLVVGGQADPALGRSVARPDEPTSDLRSKDRDGASADVKLGDGLIGNTEQLTLLDGASWMPPNTPRARHTATVLDQDRVLIAGGWDATGRATAQTELWSPAKHTWETLGPMQTARHGTATVRLYSKTDASSLPGAWDRTVPFWLLWKSGIRPRAPGPLLHLCLRL